MVLLRLSFLFLCSLFLNCAIILDYSIYGPIYLTDKSKLTNLCSDIDNDTLSFISKKLVDKKVSPLEKSDLGNGYHYESGNYKYSGHIVFWVKKIFKNDTLISAEYFPGTENMSYLFEKQYVNKFKKCGFIFEETKQDIWKYRPSASFYRESYQYLNSGTPGKSTRTVILDICSPFKTPYFIEKTSTGVTTYDIMDSIQSNITTEELKMLSNALNPIARAIAVVLIKSNNVSELIGNIDNIMNSGGKIFYLWEDIGNQCSLKDMVQSISTRASMRAGYRAP